MNRQTLFRSTAGMSAAISLGLSCALCGGCALAAPDYADDAACAALTTQTRAVDLVRCPSLSIETEQDLLAARGCREIDGDLFFRVQSIDRVQAVALPYLERVTGSLIAAPAGPLREFTLPALREVGTELSDVLEIGFNAGSLQRVSLPNLQRVHGSLGLVGMDALEDIDLGRLAVVDGAFYLGNLPRLTELALSAGVRVGQLVDYEYLCRLPYGSLPDTSASAPPQTRLVGLGCCTDDAFECALETCACDR